MRKGPLHQQKSDRIVAKEQNEEKGSTTQDNDLGARKSIGSPELQKE